MADRICSQCSVVAAPKLKFCRECGARLEDEAGDAAPPPEDAGDRTIIGGAAPRKGPSPSPVLPEGMDVDRTVLGSLPPAAAAPVLGADPPRAGTGTQTFMGDAPVQESRAPDVPEDPGDRTLIAGAAGLARGGRPAPPPPPPPEDDEPSTATFVGTVAPGGGIAPLPPRAAPPPARPEEEEPISQDIDLDDRSGATIAAPRAPAPQAPPPPPPPPPPAGAALRLEHWAPKVKTEVLTLDRPETVVGRDRGDLRYADDAYLSKKHLRYYRDEQGRPCAEDLGTLNGTFLRIRAPLKLEHRDVVALGRHVFRFELMKFEEKDDRTVEGDPLTRVQGVQGSAPRARLVKRQEEGFAGMPFFFGSHRYVLGRNEGTHIFQKDDRMSRRHASLEYREGDYWLEDLGSQNGTFLRLRGPHVLLLGDVLRAGDQYFKVL